MTSDLSLPISKLDDVWKWRAKDSLKFPVTPLQHNTSYFVKVSGNLCHSSGNSKDLLLYLNKKGVPKTLVCHDMKGGYLGDRFIHGTENPDEYRFFHWSGIDIFVYFSHHLITIPPVGWINAAHLHGVKVLGTFITEFDDGEKLCNKILENAHNIELLIEKLINICLYYGFDGWLINIENKVCKSEDQVQKLLSLVEKLTHKMHDTLPHSLVIWYDSVTIPDGKLCWQNELNVRNREFFDCCDGIYLNYSWKEENLLTSRINAGDRYQDVYVGVDVFGRNCFGGGGFNTYKALELARKHELSVAIFAPGWVHECLDTQNFTRLEYRFWNALHPHLYLHGPCTLPFKTSFCQGFGLKKYKFGKVVSSNPWYNLSLQNYQPSSGSCRHISPNSENVESKNDVGKSGCMEIYIDDAFCGGSSLILSNPRDCDEKNCVEDEVSFLQRLFVCDFCSQLSILITFATKELCQSSSELDLFLKMKTSEGNKYIFLLQESKELKMLGRFDYDTVSPLSDAEMKKLKTQYCLTDDINWFDVTPYGNWKLRHYVLNNPEGAIVEIGAMLNDISSVLLGFFHLQELKLLN